MPGTAKVAGSNLSLFFHLCAYILFSIFFSILSQVARSFALPLC